MVVSQRKSALAVSDSCETLSYSQLWERVQHLAPSFRTAPGRLTLLQGNRSAHLIAQWIACWKAGCIPMLVSDQVPQGRVHELEKLIRETPNHELAEYAVSTSGSSGQPKVVLLPKGSLVTTLQRQITYFGLSERSRVLWMLSPSFDASLSDIGTALLSGAHLYCGSDNIAAHLAQTVEEYQITHLDIPPSVLALLEPGYFPKCLKTLIVGGEASDPARLRAWSRYCRVVSVYGPTEASICTSMSVVDEDWDRPYLGQPLAEVTYRVEKGELLILGEQVGVGYLGPGREGFSIQDGKRCFTTGDKVGLFHQKHGWEFVGRLDRQVKIRGQRVELQEVENRLRIALGHSNVAVLLIHGEIVVALEGEHPPELQEKLALTLAKAWLPQRYHTLDALPRTESLKIDYSALSDILEQSTSPSSPTIDSIQVLQNALELERRGLGKTWETLESLGPDYRQGQQLLELLPAVEASTPTPRKRRHRLLVTGATGQLGRRLVPLLESEFEVWTLQRNPDRQRALKADLSLADFGLHDQDWHLLHREIDEVLHLAAQLSLAKDYDALAPVNVHSLATLAKLRRPLHLASSLAANLSSTRPDFNGPLDPQSVVIGGYAQSKWAAETLLNQISLPGYTFRLGQLLGADAKSQDWLAIVARGLKALGYAPKAKREDPLYFDFTPLEWACQQIVSILSKASQGRNILCLRRGWALHYLDLLEAVQVSGTTMECIEPADFFRLTPPTFESRLALRALIKLHPCRADNASDGYDLFLLGNLSTTQFEKAPPEAILALQDYISQVAPIGPLQRSSDR